eukprot:tig00000254_g22515.t1
MATPDKATRALLALLSGPGQATPRTTSNPLSPRTSAYERFITDQNRASVSKDRAMLPDRKLPTTRGLPDQLPTPRSPRSPRSPSPDASDPLPAPASFPDPVSAIHLMPEHDPPDSDEEPPLKPTKRLLEIQQERAERERRREEERRRRREEEEEAAAAAAAAAARPAPPREPRRGSQEHAHFGEPHAHQRGHRTISIDPLDHIRTFERDEGPREGRSASPAGSERSESASPRRHHPFLRALSRASVRSVKSHRTTAGEAAVGVASVSFKTRGKSFWSNFVDREKGGTVAAEFRPRNPEDRLSLDINYDVYNFYSRANLIPGVPPPKNPPKAGGGGGGGGGGGAKGGAPRPARTQSMYETTYDPINNNPRGEEQDAWTLLHQADQPPLPPHRPSRRGSNALPPVPRNTSSVPYPILNPPPATPEPPARRAYVPEWWSPRGPTPPIVSYLRNRRVVETRELYEGRTYAAAGAPSGSVTARF